MTRLRVTALPTALDTTKPTRGVTSRSDREVVVDTNGSPEPQLPTGAVGNSVLSAESNLNCACRPA
ncbi:hypothetical protein HMPREF9610_01982 [Cutibacterium acnes HL027PA2]|nr:hypothetical protein HMPREF9610_01982 [Cutibacterium acnes HL027PA2]